MEAGQQELNFGGAHGLAIDEHDDNGTAVHSLQLRESGEMQS
jgi:hypothetical protein